MLYPLTFEPRFKERVWGARNIERLYGKPLPSGLRIGESWEITDRPDDVSVIRNGPLAGKDVRWLMERHSTELLGTAPAESGRFPLLIKILDANDKLSLQVHPPKSKAAALGGEPKTEMWYIADAAPGADLFVGLKNGVTREGFESKLANGSVADCFHRLEVKRGDAMFLPSGRVHAIGGGNVIFEIQQNSDTTYRVFDWNRPGLDGKPRELHVSESLASINFDDFEPGLIPDMVLTGPKGSIRPLVNDSLFNVEALHLETGSELYWSERACGIVGVVSGQFRVTGGGQTLELKAGDFCLLPAALEAATIAATHSGTLLNVLAR